MTTGGSFYFNLDINPKNIIVKLLTYPYLYQKVMQRYLWIFLEIATTLTWQVLFKNLFNRVTLVHYTLVDQ